MDLSLSDEQLDIRSSMRGWVEQQHPTHVLTRLSREDNDGFMGHGWRQLAEQGWIGMARGERFGGGGGCCMDAVVLFEELGRGPVRGPMLGSGVISGSLIESLAPAALAEELVPQIVTGTRVVLPMCVAPDRLPVRVGRVAFDGGPGGSLVLTGEAVVADGASATDLLVLAHHAEDASVSCLVLVPTESAGVSVSATRGFGGGAAHVTLAGVSVPPDRSVVGPGADTMKRVAHGLAPSLPILAGYQVGSCHRMLEMSVEYSSTRRQFGRPIGTFQRVQDHVVRIVNSLDSARWTTYYAASAVDDGSPDALAACYAAKAIVAEAHVEAANAAHEVHAGVGSDLDFGLTLHSALSRAAYHVLGGPGLYRRLLGFQLITTEQQALAAPAV